MGIVKSTQIETEQEIEIDTPSFFPASAEIKVFEDGITIVPFLKNFFNGVNIRQGKNIAVLGRHITEKSANDHGVDLSDLWVLDNKGLRKFDIPLPPGVLNLEDPRCFVSTDGRIFVGLLAVQEGEKGGEAKYCPAIQEMEFTPEGILITKGEIKIFRDQIQTRDVTPYAYEDGELYFLSRIEDGKHSRILTIFKTDGNGLTQVGEIKVPEVDFGKEKIGTVGGFIERPNGKFWLYFHGQRYDERGIDHYSIGVMELSRERNNYKVERVTKRPILTREYLDFISKTELHGNRIVYSDDNPTIDSPFLVSAGDLTTALVRIPQERIEEELKEI